MTDSRRRKSKPIRSLPASAPCMFLLYIFQKEKKKKRKKKILIWENTGCGLFLLVNWSGFGQSFWDSTIYDYISNRKRPRKIKMHQLLSASRSSSPNKSATNDSKSDDDSSTHSTNDKPVTSYPFYFYLFNFRLFLILYIVEFYFFCCVFGGL